MSFDSDYCWPIAALIAVLMTGCNGSTPAPTSGNAAPGSGTPSATASADAGLPTLNRFQFTSMLADSGIRFEHESGDSPEKPFPAANGSGVGVIDYDRDGWNDLLFLTNNLFAGESQLMANQCYRNRSGWHFSDVSAKTRLDFAGHSAGVCMGDLDNDGFDDVYVTCVGRNRLFENLGDGTFAEVSHAAGVDDEKWGTSAAFLDFDADGLLDLYVANYAKWTIQSNEFCGDRERGIRMYCSPKSVPPEVDVLYRNVGDGTFEDVSTSAGINLEPGRGQGVLAADFNGDGRIDIYVSNDMNPNSLLMNQGNGTFLNQADLLGVAYDHAGTAQAGMGLACADTNRDGLLDLFVTNFEGEQNSLYVQDESGFFSEVSHLRGLAADSLPWIGWGTVLADFDCDGWSDLIVTNGHTDNNRSELGREGDYSQPSVFWENRHGQFAHIIPHDSPFFETTHPGRGLAVVDLDGDLDWDVVCCRQDMPPELLRNDTLEHSNMIAVRAMISGDAGNRNSIGAVIKCTANRGEIVEPVLSGGSYLSANERTPLLAIPNEAGGPINLSIQVSMSESYEVEVPSKAQRVLIHRGQVYVMP